MPEPQPRCVLGAVVFGADLLGGLRSRGSSTKAVPWALGRSTPPASVSLSEHEGLGQAMSKGPSWLSESGSHSPAWETGLGPSFVAPTPPTGPLALCGLVRTCP